MLFNSYLFILLFFPLTLLGYYTLGRLEEPQVFHLFLIGMSLWFYGYYNPKYLLVICSSILGNYLISRLLVRLGRCRRARVLLAVGVALNLAAIFYFKYYNFFLDNVNKLFHTDHVLRTIVLPLGISFFTFQQVSYLVDTYRGETQDYGFLEYALFVAYFPQLIAGPIVLHREIIPQFRDRSRQRMNYQNLSTGLYIFACGLFKKVLIADTFSKAVTWGFSNVDALTSLDGIVVSLAYTFQLYFDFSGYCDMAIGIARMMNIDLPQNFNSPYQSESIVDFWSRWHMSLTRFLRQYVYFPLGGSRKGKVRTYGNIMVVFLVSGLWHGANWTFVLWGAIHGLLNCLTRLAKPLWDKMARWVRWLLTFLAVDLLWVLFRAESFTQAKAVLGRILRLDSFRLSWDLVKGFFLPEFGLLQKLLPPLNAVVSAWGSFYLWAFLAGAFFIVLRLKNSGQLEDRPTFGRGLATVIILTWSIVSLSGISEFLYFGF